MITNALTFDVEDWFQVAQRKLHGRLVPASSKVIEQTHEILDLLAEHGVRATFFVVGAVAEQYPDLVRRIHGDGHEVGTHGFSHRAATSMGPEGFAEDLVRSVRILEDIIQEPVLGHRAASFSLNGALSWALEALVAAGIRYDSSLFPIVHPEYGMPNAARFPHRMETPTGAIWEFPLSTVRLLGQNIPIAGGGYLRTLPVSFVRWGVRALNREGQAAVLYVHPYDLASERLDLPVETRMPLKRAKLGLRALKRNWGRGPALKGKLETLLATVQFAPLRNVLEVCDAECPGTDVLRDALPSV